MERVWLWKARGRVSEAIEWEREGSEREREAMARMLEAMAREREANFQSEVDFQSEVEQALEWLRAWDWEQKKLQEQRQKPEARDWELERDKWETILDEKWKWMWDGGWVGRAEDEQSWMKNHREAHPNSWNEESWREISLCWKDLDGWVDRRWKRKDAIRDFKETCVTLLKELGKIDGSISAHEHNIFNASDYEYPIEDWHIVADYMADMQDAMALGDEGRFVELCKASFDLIERKLRSEEVKQGAFPHVTDMIIYIIP